MEQQGRSNIQSRVSFPFNIPDSNARVFHGNSELGWEGSTCSAHIHNNNGGVLNREQSSSLIYLFCLLCPPTFAEPCLTMSAGPLLVFITFISNPSAEPSRLH